MTRTTGIGEARGTADVAEPEARGRRSVVALLLLLLGRPESPAARHRSVPVAVDRPLPDATTRRELRQRRGDAARRPVTAPSSASRVGGLLKPGHRRLLAATAGIVVLGSGTVTSLAAWQDQAWLKVPVNTSGFQLQVSVDGGTTWYGADTTGNAQTVNMAIPSASSVLMSPGSVSTGYVMVRAAANSLGATVTLNAPTIGTDTQNLSSHLTYTMTSGVASQANCQSGGTLTAATGQTLTTIAAAGTAMTSGGASTFTIPASTNAAGTSPGSTPGAGVGVCLQVKLDPNLANTVGTGINGVGSFGNVTIDPQWTLVAQTS